jgi:hypothetical protein
MLRHVKDSNEYERNTSTAKFNNPLHAKFLLLRYKISLAVIARDLWWMNQE